MIEIEFINAFNELFAFAWKLIRLWSTMSAARFLEQKNEMEQRSLLAEVTPKNYSVQHEVGKEKFRELAAKLK